MPRGRKPGFIPWNKGIKMTEEQCEKMGRALGSVPWNKGIKTGQAPWRGKKRGPTPIETKAKMRAAHLGRKNSSEHNLNISKAVKKQWKLGKKLPVVTRGLKTEYNGIIFRSTWEARVAKALDKQGVEWEYEKQRIDLGSCTYIPDFYIPSTKTYIEVKGWMDDRSKLKLGLFREKFPELNLLVATLPVIEQLEKGEPNGRPSMEDRLGLAVQ